VHDAFLVRYEAGAQAQLPMHTDESQLSFTLALNPSADYGGGGTYAKARHHARSLPTHTPCTHHARTMHTPCTGTWPSCGGRCGPSAATW
jgi:hypothetical protein